MTDFIDRYARPARDEDYLAIRGRKALKIGEWAAVGTVSVGVCAAHEGRRVSFGAADLRGYVVELADRLAGSSTVGAMLGVGLGAAKHPVAPGLRLRPTRGRGARLYSASRDNMGNALEYLRSRCGVDLDAFAPHLGIIEGFATLAALLETLPGHEDIPADFWEPLGGCRPAGRRPGAEEKARRKATRIGPADVWVPGEARLRAQEEAVAAPDPGVANILAISDDDDRVCDDCGCCGFDECDCDDDE
jgi:hypothetical protein